MKLYFSDHKAGYPKVIDGLPKLLHPSVLHGVVYLRSTCIKVQKLFNTVVTPFIDINYRSTLLHVQEKLLLSLTWYE